MSCESNPNLLPISYFNVTSSTLDNLKNSSKSTNTCSEEGNITHSHKNKDLNNSNEKEYFNQNSLLLTSDIKKDINKDEDYYNYILENMKIVDLVRKNSQSEVFLIQFSKIRNKIENNFNEFSILCFDLDETLIFTKPLNECSSNNLNYDFSIKSNKDDENEIVGWVRPGTVELLSFCKLAGFTLCIYSAAEKNYVYDVLSELDLSQYFSFIFCRDYCINVLNNEEIIYIKPLSIFEKNDVLIIDNNLMSFSLNLKNGILVSSFVGVKIDQELFDLIEYIKSIVVNGKLSVDKNEEFFCFNEIYEEIYK